MEDKEKLNIEMNKLDNLIEITMNKLANAMKELMLQHIKVNDLIKELNYQKEEKIEKIKE